MGDSKNHVSGRSDTVLRLPDNDFWDIRELSVIVLLPKPDYIKLSTKEYRNLYNKPLRDAQLFRFTRLHVWIRVIIHRLGRSEKPSTGARYNLCDIDRVDVFYHLPPVCPKTC